MNENVKIHDASHPDKNIVWADLGMDPMDLMEGEKWEDLIIYAMENTELLTRKALSGFNDMLAKSLQTGTIVMNIVESLIKSKGIMEHALFSLGKLKGSLDIMARVISHDNQKREADTISEKYLSGIRHLDAIILLLEQNEILTHTELAKRLGNMKPPTLTENIKKIEQYGLIYSKKYGKFKYYNLTDLGLRYAESLKKRRGASGDLDRVRKELHDLLNNEETQKQTADMLSDMVSLANTVAVKEKESIPIIIDADVLDYQKQEQIKGSICLYIKGIDTKGNEMDGRQIGNVTREIPYVEMFPFASSAVKKIGAKYGLSDSDIGHRTSDAFIKPKFRISSSDLYKERSVCRYY